jgi:hypothetical protein
MRWAETARWQWGLKTTAELSVLSMELVTWRPEFGIGHHICFFWGGGESVEISLMYVTVFWWETKFKLIKLIDQLIFNKLID